MTAPHTYITTTIPYVNARPHIGFALELVQADVLARHRRGRGENVRFQAGTDDNSLKNVLAAKAEGVPVQDCRNARYELAPGVRCPSNITPPFCVYFVKLVERPQPTNQSPPASGCTLPSASE